MTGASPWLIVAGSGIAAVGQMTIATKRCIERADVVLYLLTDPITESWIQELNPVSRSLQGCYRPDEPRIYAYGRMISAMMSELRAGRSVCAVFYGHPGVFVYPGHVAVQLAREEGFSATMLPAVSAEDCLFADLGVDPATRGCQSYEATDFLLRNRVPDPTTPLILWQVGVVGRLDYQPRSYGDEGWRLLLGRLASIYGEDHECTLYEAPTIPLTEPVIRKFRLRDRAEVDAQSVSTLFVPTLREAPIDPSMAAQLGIDIDTAREMAKDAAKSYLLGASAEVG